MSIHPSAIVHPDAELGDNVEIQPYSIIEAGVHIGEGTIVGPHCVIGAGTTLGKGNRLYSGAQVGVSPQDLKQAPGAVGKTNIGDGNIFREFVTISSSTVYATDPEDSPKVTSIGDNCLFMACTHVAHDCVVGNNVIMANHASLAGHVKVEDKVIIGGLTGIHQFCHLGTMSFIGGMARVNMDALPYMIIEGHDPKCFGPNNVGLERNGLDADTIKNIRRMYKILCRSSLNTSQAVDEIKEKIKESQERDTILNFIQNSKRGIIK
jgi:UDP-N-acetylglucosamine acyltransferase